MYNICTQSGLSNMQDILAHPEYGVVGEQTSISMMQNIMFFSDER